MIEMKKYNFYILRLLSVSFLLSLFACGADETDGLSNEVDTTERPLTISAQLGTAVTTRATTITTQLEEGSIGVYRKTTNGYDALNNILYSWNDISNSWKSDDEADRTKTLYVGNRFADVYAYYPYSTSQGSSPVFNLVMGRYNQEDVMYYAKTIQVNNSAAQANFAMKSPYSRITFQIKNSNMSSCLVKDFKISFKSKINAMGSIDISADNPTVIGQFPIESYDFELSGSDPIYDTGIAAGDTNDELDLLMIPQDMSTMTITVQLALSNADISTIASVTISSNAFSDYKLKQGQQYIIPLLIQGAAIVFDSKAVPELTPNPDEDPYNDKEITAYTLPPVELGDDLEVATGNLYYYVSQIIDPEKNPNYEKDGENRWYGFAARNGQMFPERHSTPVNTFTYSTSMDDFCKRVGSNWKMPTRAQLQALADLANSCSSSGTCDDGGNTVDGWWIGNASSSVIPPATSRSTDVIFLTAGTYLDSDGGYLSVPSGSNGPIAYTSSGTPPATSFIRCVTNK